MKYIYCDGGCAPTNPGPGGYGVVAFNNDNEILWTSEFFDSMTTNNIKELKALLKAIKEASKMEGEVII